MRSRSNTLTYYDLQLHACWQWIWTGTKKTKGLDLYLYLSRSYVILLTVAFVTIHMALWC
jgi:hypothetical protein